MLIAARSFSFLQRIMQPRLVMQSHTKQHQITFFSGSPLDRLSQLRSDDVFLANSLAHLRTRFLLVDSLRPLFDASGKRVAYIGGDTESLVSNGEAGASTSAMTADEAASVVRTVAPLIDSKVFLGVDTRVTLPDELTINAPASKQKVKHPAIWALDVTMRDGKDNTDASVVPSSTALAPEIIRDLKRLHEYTASQGFMFKEARPSAFRLPFEEAALVAASRSILDWHTKTCFCAQCGQPTRTSEGGWKRSCPPSPCPVHKGVQNTVYPRTDPVVIMLILHGDRALLGRQKSWPRGLYSCVAGFMEPGESLEEAVRREVREETGVSVGQVQYRLSQPWPFPSSLMLGCWGWTDTEGTSLSSPPIPSLEDKELEDARWVTMDEVRQALLVAKSLDPKSNPAHPDVARAASSSDALLLPPPFAVAHQLLEQWVTEGEGKRAKM